MKRQTVDGLCQSLHSIFFILYLDFVLNQSTNEHQGRQCVYGSSMPSVIPYLDFLQLWVLGLSLNLSMIKQDGLPFDWGTVNPFVSPHLVRVSWVYRDAWTIGRYSPSTIHRWNNGPSMAFVGHLYTKSQFPFVFWVWTFFMHNKDKINVKTTTKKRL